LPIGGRNAASLAVELVNAAWLGCLVKVMSWYDDEWGYASQMVREALRIAREKDLKGS